MKSKKNEEIFQVFLMSIEDNLIDLECAMNRNYHLNYKFDFTIDSLDKVEGFLYEQLENYTIELFPEGKLIENISTYMGEIIIRKLNGHWELERNEKDIDFGYPIVQGLDGLPEDFGWCPIQVVFNFRRKKKIGLLKRATKSLFI